jgi:hypothetical protein
VWSGTRPRCSKNGQYKLAIFYCGTHRDQSEAELPPLAPSSWPGGRNGYFRAIRHFVPIELHTKGLAKIKDFYSRLSDWKRQDISVHGGNLPYTLITTGTTGKHKRTFKPVGPSKGRGASCRGSMTTLTVIPRLSLIIP